MSETNAGQGPFSFGSNLPPEAGWERPGGRTVPETEAGVQSRRPDLSDALQGRARRSRRGRGGATPAAAPQPVPDQSLRWLTSAEATGYLGFPTRKALYCAVERGQVPAHKLGRRLRFRSEELDALLGAGSLSPPVSARFHLRAPSPGRS
jgi:excisionase family DNA binding protein